MSVAWTPREPEPTGHNTLNYTEQGGDVLLVFQTFALRRRSDARTTFVHDVNITDQVRCFPKITTTQPSKNSPP